MNDLTPFDANRINELLIKIQQRTASGTEMREFFNLAQKSGQNNWFQLQQYLLAAGYSSPQEFQQRMNEKEAEEFWQGLATIGAAILAAYAISKMFGKR